MKLNRLTHSLDEGMDVGEDPGTPVNLDDDVPHKFAGRFETVTIDLHPGDRADVQAADKAHEAAAIRRSLRD